MDRLGLCECSACKAKAKPKREPGSAFGANSQGEWRQLNTYYPQFIEDRWKHWIERERKRKEKMEVAT